MAVNLTTNLEAFYKLDDVNDSSGNGNTLTNNGDVQFTSGKIGNAAEFDGTNFLQFEDLNIDTDQPTSISVWLKQSSQNSTPMVFGQDGIANISIRDNGFIGIYSGALGVRTTDVIATFGDWYHVVVVAGETVKVYVNNVLKLDINESVTFVVPEQQGFIGGEGRGEFDGQIDAVGIWNRALNDSEIAALYNEGNGLEEFSSLTDGSSFSVKIEGNTKFFGKVKFA